MDKASDGSSENNTGDRAAVDTEIPSTSTGRGNHTIHSHFSQDNCTSNVYVSSRNNEHPKTNEVGSKRKLEENENETYKFQRQRKHRCTNEQRERGVKRKLAYNHTEQPKKRFKPTPSEIERVQHDKATVQNSDINSEFDEKSHAESLISKSNLEIEDTRSSDIQPVTGTSGDSSDKEYCTSDSVEADDNVPCPASCVCNVGHSRLPPRTRRQFDTQMPLRRSLLMCLSCSRSNRRFTCCESRCVKKLSRSTIRNTALLFMIQDYDYSDLRVHQYSWGEWKE